jgi:hypothetical protein
MRALADDRFRVLERLKARASGARPGVKAAGRGIQYLGIIPIRNLCVAALSEKFFLSRKAKIT